MIDIETFMDDSTINEIQIAYDNSQKRLYEILDQAMKFNDTVGNPTIKDYKIMRGLFDEFYSEVDFQMAIAMKFHKMGDPESTAAIESIFEVGEKAVDKTGFTWKSHDDWKKLYNS